MKKSFTVKRTVVEVYYTMAENGIEALDNIKDTVGPDEVRVIKETAMQSAYYQNQYEKGSTKRSKGQVRRSGQ